MLAEMGSGILGLAFLISLYGCVASLVGVLRPSIRWAESARAAIFLTFPLISLASTALIYLLVNRHYEVQYVYGVTSNLMPLYLKITALWGGQAGSLLFWCWILSGFAFITMLRRWEMDRQLFPWVAATCLLTGTFFIGLVLFVENPFQRFWIMPNGGATVALFRPTGGELPTIRDGMGLNPLLRHPGMVLHPPFLYLGFAAFVTPFAYATATLATGGKDDRWIRLTRRWTLAAWLFLSLGLILGSRWAYDVLGWGGYWNWDPVEIAALMPWLSGTAYLHSVMIQEKRGMFKRWNIVLIILTYALVIFGTFLTRSGILSSVHAFAQSSIGPLFFGFISLAFIGSLGLLLYRWNDLAADRKEPMTSWFSREALFLLNNVLFLGILFVCFLGVLYPVISELVTGQKVTVGPPYYERAAGPMFAALLVLMGIVPLSSWGHSTLRTIGRTVWKPLVVALAFLVVLALVFTHEWKALLAFFATLLAASVTLYEFGRAILTRSRLKGESVFRSAWKLAGRNRRRYGGYIIHLGVVMMALGIIGIELFQTQTQGRLKPGDSLPVANYEVVFKGLNEFDTNDGRNIVRAVVEVRNEGRLLTELYPRRDFYYDAGQSMTIPGTRSTLKDDLYVVLADWQPISIEGATFKAYHNPLVNWLWLGGMVFILGTLVAAWPEVNLRKEAEQYLDRESEPAKA